MSLIPRFEDCLVCEMIRPELNGKLVILGFFGICPNVDVRIQRPDQPILLTFLVTGGPGDGNWGIVFDVVDESDQRVIASTAEMPFFAIPAAATSLAPTLLLVFGHPGAFALRANLGGEEHFRAAFAVSQLPISAESAR